MKKVVFEGPGPRHVTLIGGVQYVFLPGIEQEVPDEVATVILALNPHKLPLTVKPLYSAQVAADYGCFVFHEVKAKDKHVAEGGEV